jgi:hypothetical protein
LGLFLGGVQLDGFEVTAQIGFGGRQALTVHTLPGGTRIIDAMGADDHDIAWHGVLSGPDASDRARMLDSLRVAGTPVGLAWDVFAATVIVSDLRLQFCNSWWIPYQLRCKVLVGTQTAASLSGPVSALADVIADLDQANSVPGVAAAIALVNEAGGAMSGSLSYAAASSSLAQAQAGIAQSIAAADAGMQTADIAGLVTAAGSLAMLSAASGFVGRASANFTGAAF